jgi:hypothetical protein
MNSGCKEISSIYFRIGFPLNLHTVINNPDLKLKRMFCVPGAWKCFVCYEPWLRVSGLFDMLFSCWPVPEKLMDKDFLEKLISYLLPFIVITHYTRRGLLLSAGHVAENLYFSKKGFARGFFIHKKSGREITDFLWSERSIITIPHSFFQQQPTQTFIEVMPGTELMSISFHDLRACIKRYPVVEVFSRNVILQYNAYETKRSYELSSLSACSKERICFVTNILDKDRYTLAKWYKQRWEIETFFKFIKQHPNVKHLVSRNENGIKVMIYMTMILVILIIAYKKINAIKGFKIAKLKFGIELENEIIKTIVTLCEGDLDKAPHLFRSG